ncbi:MAG: type III-A CRISPR-associated protein Cas10/Csm1 [Chloroflexi bacterium]|nr:type III-A CRISPR-associated protein Cas10/Csm1 [Chloroflexota bacterium]
MSVIGESVIEQRHYAALAGLLHDIGKLRQRGMSRPDIPPEDFREEAHQVKVHAAYSGAFIQATVPPVFQSAALPGYLHHAGRDFRGKMTSPQQFRLSQIVQLADRLAAGERIDESKSEDLPQGKEMRLHNPLLSVALGDQMPKLKDSYLPLGPTRVEQDADFLPTGDAQDMQTQRQAYDTLWQEFERQARDLQTFAWQADQIDGYIESLYLLMGRYTGNVPSAYYYSTPDISLFDHSRSVAALASTLCDFSDAELAETIQQVQDWFQARRQSPQAPPPPALAQKRVALLVGGDIAGIQKFIYTLSTDKAARTLRGRSLYLQLLAEGVLRYILARLGLPLTAVVYSGGGRFYLLVPPSCASGLAEIRREVTHKLLRHHGTDLYLALGWTELCAADFTPGAIAQPWGRMQADLSRAKQTRYRELEPDEIYQLVLKPDARGGNDAATCNVCHAEWPRSLIRTRRATASEAEETDEKELCPLCKSFVDLGRALPRATHLLLGLAEAQTQKRQDCFTALREFGLQVNLWDGKDFLLEQPLSPERVVQLALQDPTGASADPPIPSHVPVSHGVHYLVNLVPKTARGDIKTFEEMIEGAQGIERLGVLRMDMDNLGSIFGQGLGERMTLARLAALSRSINLFFEGRVAALCRRVDRDAEGESLYAVYAGGDDLFLIGPWQVMPELAQTIHDDLERFAGGNPAIHVSAGIALIQDKYPVYQAAEDAHAALEHAKALVGKNAITFLGRTLPWDNDKVGDFADAQASFEELKGLQAPTDQAEDAKDQGGRAAPKALLRKLLEIDAEYTAYKTAWELQDPERRLIWQNIERPLWGPWMWHTTYALKQMKARYTKQPALQAGIEALHIRLVKQDFRNLPAVGLAARWVELLTRQGNKTDHV